MEEQSEEFVYDDPNPLRLDVFLTTKYPNYSRSYWHNMINHDYVLVDNEQIKSGYKLRSGGQYQNYVAAGNPRV